MIIIISAFFCINNKSYLEFLSAVSLICCCLAPINLQYVFYFSNFQLQIKKGSELLLKNDRKCEIIDVRLMKLLVVNSGLNKNVHCESLL